MGFGREVQGNHIGLGECQPAVILVIKSFGQNDFELSIFSTIYKYFIFIYSE